MSRLLVRRVDRSARAVRAPIHARQGRLRCGRVTMLTAPPEGPSQRSHWIGALAGKRTNATTLSLVLPVKRGTSGTSGAFLAVASDDLRYWIKPLNNLQDPRVCVTEQIVGRIGHLLGAPTRRVATINIPDMKGWKFVADNDAAVLLPGIAHASLDLPSVIETSQLEQRTKDSNASRHAHLLALYDLCWGDDSQWLLDLSDDFACHSFDHGHFFPQGPWWTTEDLERCLTAPRPLRTEDDDIDVAAVKGAIARMRSLRHDEIVDVLAHIPTSWPVKDAELEMVGHFLLTRAPLVAHRLETRFREAAT